MAANKTHTTGCDEIRIQPWILHLPMERDGLTIPEGRWCYQCPPWRLGAAKLLCCDGFHTSRGILDLAAETETVPVPAAMAPS